MNFKLTPVAAAARHFCLMGRPSRQGLAPGKAVGLAMRYGQLGKWLLTKKFKSKEDLGGKHVQA